MVTRPSGSLGGALYDGFNMIFGQGLAAASSAVGIDPDWFWEQFSVPATFSLMPWGVGSMLLDQAGI